MNQNNNYSYESIEQYYTINLETISNLQQSHQENQNDNSYIIYLDYYYPFDTYYLEPPENYILNLEELKQNKEDIFSKGKILTFYNNNDNFTFDAIVDFFEIYIDENENENYYCYIQPIKKKYRNYRRTYNLCGYYNVKERTGDLTYIRMEDALNEFHDNDCCSHNLKLLIIGNNINNHTQHLNNLFNYRIRYKKKIRDYGNLSQNQISNINNIFNYELNTIELNDNKIMCFIINAIFQRRRRKKNKILICTSSNAAADQIALDLMEMNYYTNSMNLLRIYAKNQEIIERDENLNQIAYHILKRGRSNYYKRKLIRDSDIIISTCVNSYCDELINYNFPFVIIADANNSNENESLIPITLHAKHLIFISYVDNNNDNNNNNNNENNNDNNNENINDNHNNENNNEINMYKRMKNLYQNSHFIIL